jgi:hypothetical protein
MAVVERQTTQLTFFGRLADDLTRRPVTSADVSLRLDEGAVDALKKDDGHFAFVDLAPSAADYHIRVTGPAYETRVFASKLPATAPLQVTFAGEDELYVVVSTVSAAQNRVTFASIPLLPAIDAGASVIGEGGFTGKLAEPMGGLAVQSAVLDSVAGLAAGRVLRIVRSPSLLLRAGPYYPFPTGLTVIALRIAENTPEEAPIPGATVTLTRLNGATPTNVAVDTLTVRNFTVGTGTLVLDDLHRASVSNDRGDAVLYLGGEAAVTSAQVDLTALRYQPANVTFAVTAKGRTFTKMLMTKV